MTKESANKRKKHEPVVKKPDVSQENVRLRRKPFYKSFKLQKRMKHPGGPLPSSWKLTKKTLFLLRQNKRNLFTFVLIYALLYLIFVRGFTTPVDIDGIREGFKNVLARDLPPIIVNFSVVTLMLESATSAAGELQSLYQVMFYILGSLSLIWLFRQQQAGNEVTMKDAWYRGMYPLVPFSLLALLLVVQSFPASIGNFLVTAVFNNDLAVTVIEQVTWLFLFGLLLILSAYLMTTTVVALFVSTLPEMTPKIALEKAKQMVKLRRMSIMRKIIGLATFLVIVFVAAVFPAIFVSAIFAQLVYFILTVLLLPYAVAYLFVLYRELL